MNNQPIAGRIHILDQQTANQIAAGEVVERPFSVVKELVENAIDAGASKITVTLFDQSLEKIQVSDNGCGMNRDELRLAVLRHATSKIMQITDLNSLNTLGFRGEALPSIASVSELTISSKTKDGLAGYSMVVKEGKASIPQEVAANRGTTVLVDRLFHNTPARKKFLKSHRTELGLISDLLAKYIVAYPNIAFKLVNGAHTIYQSSGKGDRQAALFESFGKNIAGQMIPFAYGYLSPPTLNRPNRGDYHFFINGRPARCRELTQAIDSAYFSFVPAKRYPIVFIMLDIDPAEIDVNVHPGKLEIKFHHFAQLEQELIAAIIAALGSSDAPELPFNPKQSPKDNLLNLSSRDELANLAPPPSQPQNSYHNPLAEQAYAAAEPGLPSGEQLYRALYDYSNVKNSPAPTAAPTLSQNELFTSADEAKEPATLRYGSLDIIGQFAGTFILASQGEDLYIIDQHAAAERILYEKIASRAEQQQGDSSGLAVPIQMELSYKEGLQLIDAIVYLNELGFIIEHFGDNSFIIRGVPLWYSGNDPEQLLRLYLDELNEKSTNLTRIRKAELFMAACKQAIKANRFLTASDIAVLLQDLDACLNSVTCPHGRPIAIKLSRAEIYKRFLRGSI